MNNLFDVTILGRKPEYYDGVEQRVGFPVRDGNAFLVHTAGVSYRQESLERIETLCKFDRSPQMRLELDPENQWDSNAVKVMVAIGFDDVTGSAVFNHVGFLPKGRCPFCARSLSGQKSSAQICPDCNADIGLTSSVAQITRFNRFIADNFDKISVGVDTVTRSGAGNLGLDLWVRIND